MADRPPVIDAQVHAYERDHPARPWHAVLHGPPEVTGDDMVAAMDDVGVDGALLVSPWTMYRYDASYALEVFDAHPTRFGLIKPVDVRLPDAGDVVREWSSVPGAVGARIMMTWQVDDDAFRAGIDSVLEAGGATGLPINILCWGALGEVEALAERHPQTRIVVDHLGLSQPFEPPAPPDAWEQLPAVLNLARYDNIVVKVTGACTLSQQAFPYDDIWEPLGRMFDAFGFDRLLWGTDWTRAVELLTYRQGVEAFSLGDRLSDAEREALMGGTLADVYGWQPDHRTGS